VPQRDGGAGANLLDVRDGGKSEATNREAAKAGDGLRGDGAGGAVQTRVAPAIVIGFVGGFVRHENAVHSPVQVAAKLRKEYPDGVYVEVFENHRREEAYRRILEILGTGGSRSQESRSQAGTQNDEKGSRAEARHYNGEAGGSVSEEQKRQARIIIYGMSWGGTETVALAKELKAQKIPVLLTVQVDSVAKIGEDGGVIPANVGEAVNFFQDNGLLHGRAEIRAEDAGRTKILGNFRYDYKAKPVSCNEYPWYDRMLTKYHTEIECDPAVWGRVEALIREKLTVPSGPAKAD
jgi:hypothetical protein